MCRLYWGGVWPLKVDRLRGCYASIVSVMDRASTTSGNNCPQHEYRRRELYLMHQRITFCRFCSGLAKTFLSRNTSLFIVESKDSASVLSARTTVGPMDWDTPRSWHRAPNAGDVYTLP